MKDEEQENLHWCLVQHSHCVQVHSCIDTQGEKEICYDYLPIQGRDKDEVRQILVDMLIDIDNDNIANIKDVARHQYQLIKEDILSDVGILRIGAYGSLKNAGRDRGNAIDGFFALIHDAEIKNTDAEINVLVGILYSMRKEAEKRRDTLTASMLTGDLTELANTILDDVRVRGEIMNLQKLAAPRSQAEVTERLSKFLMGEETI